MFDRCPLQRENPAWLQARRDDAGSRWLLFAADSLRVAVVDDDGERPATAAGVTGPAPALEVFLGCIGDAGYWARFHDEADAPAAFRDLRDLADTLEPDWLEMLGMARSLLAWHRAHRYCGHCGSATETRLGGQARSCTDISCARELFPRTDPAIIVLILAGDETLLVNKPQWPRDRRSVVAGFVDPAETMEAAVRREVLEETGILVDRVRYLRSQGWPYPGSLMLACSCEAQSREIRLGTDGELRAAEWYTRDQLRTEVDAGRVLLPPRQAVSRWLIDHWLAGA